MPAIDPNRVRDLFLAAAELPETERSAYLRKNCGSNAELRGAIERLLLAHANPISLVNPATIEYSPELNQNLESSFSTGSFDVQPDRGGVVVGKYKLIELIGEGGMGAVWSARQTEPVKRMVAVKLIKPGMDSKAVLARFDAERQALAMMDHPHIARVLDGGTTSDNRPYFVMELVKGVPITKYCDDRKLPTRQRLELFVMVCQAIQHAHQKGVIHRDIKPSNVLVARYDDRAVPKVIDFGVAKATGQLLTEMTLNTGFGNIVGTPEYMSPEQATFNNLDIDTRSDVYALGVLLYELLTGGPPLRKSELEKAGILEILRVVKEVDPPRPSTRVSTAAALPTVAANRGTNPSRLKTLLRNELDWIVMKALEKDRSRRYETANGLASDIKRHLAGEEVMAVPPSIGYRLGKFVRKHRGPVIAGLFVFLALVLGVFGTTVGLLRAESARMIAETEAENARRSREAETVADSELKKHIGLTNVAEGMRLVDRGDSPLGILRIAHAMKTAPGVSEVHDLARMQLALNGRFTQFPLRLLTRVPRTGTVVPSTFIGEGRRVVVCLNERTAQIWDLETGQPLSPPLEHPDTITALASSADGKTVLTGCSDGKINFWNGENGQSIPTSKQLKGTVKAIAFTEKGILALTAGSDGLVQVWNVESAKAFPRLASPNSAIRSVAFSPSGLRVVIGTFDANARLYEFETGKQRFQMSSHTDSVEAVAFSPDSQKILTGSNDQTVRLWDADTGKAILTAPHSDSVVSLTFSPDGKHILTGCNDNVSRIWRFDSTKSSLIAATPHTGPVETVAFSSKGDFAFIACTDGTCQRREIALNVLTAVRSVVVDAQISSVAYSPDGRRVATGHKNGSTSIWDKEFRKTISIATPHRGSVTALAFSWDGRLLATGSEDKTARVCDAETGTQISSLELLSPVRSAAFSPDGKLVAIGNSYGKTFVWNSRSTNGRQPLKLLPHGDSVKALAFSSDGKLLMVGGANKQVRIWQVESEQEILPLFRHPDAVESVAISQDRSRALSGCKNGSVTLFEIGTDHSMTLNPAHTSPVSSVAFSPDGNWALTGSEDGSIRIWDVKSGVTLSPRIQHSVPIVNAAFSTDGKNVILGNLNKASRVISLATNEHDERSVADTVHLAELNSSHRIDESGRFVPLSSAELNALYVSLRAKYPEEFTR